MDGGYNYVFPKSFLKYFSSWLLLHWTGKSSHTCTEWMWNRTPKVQATKQKCNMKAVRQLKNSFSNYALQVADDSTLYGCCVLVEELVQKPSGLLSVSEKPSSYSSLSRYVLTTRRCYCILSRLPFFELHFGVLNRYVCINCKHSNSIPPY